MAKIARSTCTGCHQILPRNEMFQISKSYVSGASFGQRSKSGRSTNRVYTRTRKVWVCSDCYNQERSKTLWTAGIFLAAVGAILMYGMLLG